eukprot:364666-Chlamydomonas_euryale.AAC.5
MSCGDFIRHTAQLIHKVAMRPGLDHLYACTRTHVHEVHTVSSYGKVCQGFIADARRYQPGVMYTSKLVRECGEIHEYVAQQLTSKAKI